MDLEAGVKRKVSKKRPSKRTVSKRKVTKRKPSRPSKKTRRTRKVSKRKPSRASKKRSTRKRTVSKRKPSRAIRPRARMAPAVHRVSPVHAQPYDFQINGRILPQVWPTLTLSHGANALLILLTQKGLLHKLKTSGSTTPQSIIQVARTKIKGDLGMHIETEVTKAVTRFNNQQLSLLSGNMILFDQLVGNATAAGVVASAAAVEYIVAELTELAGGATRGRNSDVMTETDIYAAIAADTELSRLFPSKVPTADITHLTDRIVAAL